MSNIINLCEILKDCPKGTEFYSPIFGVVTLNFVRDNSINVQTKNGDFNFRPNGTICLAGVVTCNPMIFPSEDQPDWSKWKCPKPKFDPKTLKAFDRVLAKTNKWDCRFFNRLEDDYDVKMNPISIMTSGGCFSKCVPYNDETKHLVGTSDEAPEYYRYWEE